MNIPHEILNDLKIENLDDSSMLAVRALTDYDGNIGETYIFEKEQVVQFYSGKLGESYKRIESSYRDWQDFEISIERPFAYLSFTIETKKNRLKFAAFDLKKLEEFKKHWENNVGVKANRDVTAIMNDREEIKVANEEVPVSNIFAPMLGFSAALQAMAHADNRVSGEEYKSLGMITSHQMLEDGLRYWKLKGTENLFTELRDKLSEDQKKCLLANMLELAMVDGVLEDKEKSFLEEKRNILGVSIENFNKIFDILLLKNNLTIF